MKVLIVGLPLFAERLRKELNEFDFDNTYYNLDTYYSKKDKLKALFMIPFVDVVYSINGTLGNSGVINLALKFKKKVMFTWVGTDVVKAGKLVVKNERYLHAVEHYCEVGWIQEELEELGVKAEILNFVSFNKNFDLKEPITKRLQVLSYIPDNRAEFYGMKEYLELARSFPEIDFTIAGAKAEAHYPLPVNITALGWVKDMNALMERIHVCVRFPEHDGLSSFILESLARGKKVIYKYPFHFCETCASFEDMKSSISRFNSDFLKGEIILNEEGKKFIESNFNSDVILGTLVEKIIS
jgi:hypothetical protein